MSFGASFSLASLHDGNSAVDKSVKVSSEIKTGLSPATRRARVLKATSSAVNCPID